MKILKAFGLVLFFAACAGVGGGATYEIMKLWKAGRATENTVLTGTGSAPPWRGVEAAWGPGFGETVKGVARAHGTAVAIEWPGDAAKLKEAVAAAHGEKLAAVVTPAGDFSAKDPYPAGLAAVAAAAQAAGADALCVSWANGDVDEKYWREQIAAVRKNYRGKVIFGVSGEAMADVGLWDAVDYSAVVGPVELPRRLAGASGAYTVDDARALWASELDEWESIGIKSGKPLVLLDVSLAGTVGETLPVGGGRMASAPEAVREIFYKAVLVETRGRGSTQGLLLSVEPRMLAGVLRDAGPEWSGEDHAATGAAGVAAAP